MVMQQAAEHRIPTGVVDGPPMASTGLPRDKPEVAWMATARAVAGSRWLCTSAMSRRPGSMSMRNTSPIAGSINDGATHRDYAAGGGSPLRTFMTVRSHLVSYIPPGRAAGH